MTQAAPPLSRPAPPPPSRCPVCGARFRGSVTCSRCGTDLGPLMRLAARAWAARDRCRRALLAGHVAAALRLAAAARRLQDAGRGV